MRYGQTLTIMIAALFLAGGCITGESPKTAQDASYKSYRQGEVQDSWQKELYKKLEENPQATMAIGFFSEGGWADAGQVLVIGSKDTANMYRVPPTGKALDSGRKLSASEKSRVMELGKTLGELKDIRQKQFDGLRYEILLLTRTDSGIKFNNRLHIQAAEFSKHPEHGALVEFFSGLK